MRREAESQGESPAARLRAADLIIPAAFCLLYFLWSTTLPVDMAPDEYMRYPVPLSILKHGTLPNGFDPEIRNSIWGFSYAFYPYGSSLASVAFMRLASLFTTSEAALVIASRQVSVLSGAGTLLVCELIGKRVFSGRLTPYVLAIVVGALPQFAFLASYLNNEAFMVLCVAGILLTWIDGMRDAWRPKRCVQLGVWLGLCALSYYYAFIYLLASVPVFFLTARPKERGRGEDFRAVGMDGDGALAIVHGAPRPPHAVAAGRTKGAASVWRRAALVLTVALAVGGWFYARNIVLYEGDAFGMRASAESSEMYAQEEFKPSNRIFPRREGLSVMQTVFGEYRGMVWWKVTAQSAVALFGYMSVTMPGIYYRAYCAVSLALFVAGIGYLLRGRRFCGKGTFFFACALCGVFVVCMAIYYSWASDYQPQGRYLFASLVPAAIVVAGGTECLSRIMGGGSGRSGHVSGQLVEGWGGHGAPDRRGEGIAVAVIIFYLVMLAVAGAVAILPQCVGGVL